MSTQPRIVSREILQNVGIVRSSSTGLEGFGDLFEGLKDVAQGIEDRGVEEAAEDGRNAGIARDDSGQLMFVPRDGKSRADKAFNAAGKQTYLARLETDQRRRFTEMRTETGDDYETFTKTATAYSEGLISQVPETLRTDAELIVQNLLEQNTNAISGIQRTRAYNMQKNTIEVQRNAISQDLRALARGGQAGSEAFAQGLAKHEENLQSAIKAGFISDESADIQRNAMADETEALGIASTVLNEYHRRGGGVEAVSAANDELQTVLNDPELSGMSEAARSRVVNYTQEMIRENEATRRGMVREVEARTKPVLRRLALGYPVASGELANIRDEAAALNEPALLAEIDTAITVQADVAAFSKQPLTNMRAEMERIDDVLKAGGGDDADITRLVSYNRAYDAKRREIQNDALSYGAEAYPQLVGDLEQLDFSTGDGLAQSLKVRVEQAEKVADLEGLPSARVLPLKAEEVSRLTTSIASMDASQKAALSASLADGTGARHLPKVLSALELKGTEGRVFSIAAGISLENPEVGRQMFVGLEFQKAENKVLPKNNETLRTEMQPVYTALRMRPDRIAPITDAVMALYAYDSGTRGDYSGVLDTNRLREAVAKITGPVLKHKGQPIIAPKRGMTQTDFDRVMAGLTDSDLGQVLMDPHGQRITAENIQEYGTLLSVGDGRYEVRINGQEIVDSTGQKYLLDLRDVEPQKFEFADPYPGVRLR